MDRRDAVTSHRELVDTLDRQGRLDDPLIARAFRRVDRAYFLPGLPPEQIYADTAIPTKFDASGTPISSSSQPTMMAIMLKQLDLRPGMKILEIGTGTGYNAALLAEITGPAGHVFSIDIDTDIIAAARDHLNAAGYSRVILGCADAIAGWPEFAPFDRIVMTVGMWDFLPVWLDQLALNGLFLAPVVLGVLQVSTLFRRSPEHDHLESIAATPCQFMLFRGDASPPDLTCNFAGPDGEMRLTLETPPRVPPTAASFLSTTTLPLALSGLNISALYFIAAHSLNNAALHLFDTNNPGQWWGYGLVVWNEEEFSGCFLPYDSLISGAVNLLYQYGTNTATVRLLALLNEWSNVGRPGWERVRISIFPKRENSLKPAVKPGELLRERPHCLVLSSY